MSVAPACDGVLCHLQVVMPPFEEVGVYCFANVGWLVSRQTLSDQ